MLNALLNLAPGATWVLVHHCSVGRELS